MAWHRLKEVSVAEPITEELERKERPAFEQWARQNAFSLKLPARDGYPALTQVAWKAWLARAAHGVPGTFESQRKEARDGLGN